MTDAVGTTEVRRIIDGTTWLWLAAALAGAAVLSLLSASLSTVGFQVARTSDRLEFIAQQITWSDAILMLASVIVVALALESGRVIDRRPAYVLTRVNLALAIIVLVATAYSVWDAITLTLPDRSAESFASPTIFSGDDGIAYRLRMVVPQLAAALLAVIALIFIQRILASRVSAKPEPERPPARWEDFDVDERRDVWPR